MFPRLRDRLGSALDLVVEFSTLGEYSLGAHGAAGRAGAAAPALEHAPQLGGPGRAVGGAAVRCAVAGGAAAHRSRLSGAPAATPAARRVRARDGRESAGGASDRVAGALDGALAGKHSPAGAGRPAYARQAPPARAPSHRTRAGAPTAPEQLCLAAGL